MKKPRSTGLADALFSKAKQAVIGILFSQEGKVVHVRELARIAGMSAPTLAKELDVLVSAGLVLEERDGNRRSVRANPASPIFEELKGIAVKTAGVAEVIRAALCDLDGIDLAFVFGSTARGEARSGSDVDVCVVGTVKNRLVMNAAATAEQTLRRPVNALVYTPDEFRAKMGEGNTFVERISGGPKIFLVGDQVDFDHLSAVREAG